MIVHVWRRAMESQIADVVVATDDTEIFAVVEAAGGKAVMTRADHPSGSDRIWEALQQIDPQGRYSIILNVQGDLPTLDPALLHELVRPFSDPMVDITTLAAMIDNERDLNSPSVVKPVIAFSNASQKRGRCLYFSRATVPHGEGAHYHHIGLYGYRRKTLEQFVSLPPSPLELREKLEQLRALEAGMRIEITIVDTQPLGVDTQEDLEKARSLLCTD